MKVAPCYFEEFRDVGMSQEYSKAVCARYKADVTDLQKILSLAEQHTFVRSLDTDPTNSVPEGMEDEKDNQNFEGMVPGNEVTSSSPRGKFCEV